MGAVGDEQAASEYRRAAHLEQGAATMTAQQFMPQAAATWIKQQQTAHAVFGAIGQQVAQVGASGFKAAGTNTALLASSARQGALAVTSVAMQGQADMQALMGKAFSEEQQISADQAMAKREDTAAMGSIVGGMFGAAGGLLKGIGSMGA
jgi:hypothetical protein